MGGTNSKEITQQIMDPNSASISGQPKSTEQFLRELLMECTPHGLAQHDDVSGAVQVLPRLPDLSIATGDSSVPLVSKIATAAAATRATAPAEENPDKTDETTVQIQNPLSEISNPADDADGIADDADDTGDDSDDSIVALRTFRGPPPSPAASIRRLTITRTTSKVRVAHGGMPQRQDVLLGHNKYFPVQVDIASMERYPSFRATDDIGDETESVADSKIFCPSKNDDVYRILPGSRLSALSNDKSVATDKLLHSTATKVVANGAFGTAASLLPCLRPLSVINTSSRTGNSATIPTISTSTLISLLSFDTAPAATECPKYGIRLSYILDEFIEKKCGGPDALKGLSTEQVCQQYIKPHTQHLKSSYCGMILAESEEERRQEDWNSRCSGNKNVAPCTRSAVVCPKAQVFISHAHQFEFISVMDALQYHLRDTPDIYIWFDIFVINQHQPMDWTFEWLSNTFQSSIENFGRTVMVLSPWSNPLPFQRAWCIFEVYCTAIANNSFEIALARQDRIQFLQDVQKNPEKAIDQLLGTIQAEKSHCLIELDQQRIFDVIRKTVGFAKINAMVFEQYRDWVITVAKEALDGCVAMTKERCRLLKVVGMLYLGQGINDQAEFFLRTCWEECKVVLGESHNHTLRAMNNLARAYIHQGHYDRACVLLQECRNRCSCLDCSEFNHRVALDAMHYLAIVHHSEREYDKALQLYENVIKHCSELLGDNHRDTLASMNGLASLYDDRGEYDKALALYEECLTKLTAESGETHPNTLSAMNNLALFCKRHGEYDEALPLYEKCLERRTAALGDTHPDTLLSMNNLASLWFEQDRYDKARPLYENCLKMQRVILGESHPSTLTSINNLATLHDHQGNYDRALSLYKECLGKQRQTLGDNHPDTLISMNNLASFYSNRGELDLSLQLYKECLSKRRIVLGMDHPETLQSIHNLAVMYEEKYKFTRDNNHDATCGRDEEESCQSLYEECLQRRRAVFGSSHQDTMTSMVRLALWYDWRHRQYVSAKEIPGRSFPSYDTMARSLAKECESEAIVTYGGNHPLTQAMRRHLSCILRRCRCLESPYDEVVPTEGTSRPSS